jgi:ubiquinone/menaquinone biosynthesis C-methylase UbiE
MTMTVEDLKLGHRAIWAAGDYAAVAEIIDDVPPAHLLRTAAIRPGEEVLDVATGTGNVALRAAAEGANVVGLDLTPELFGTARERAAEYGVAVDWVEGDAEALPFVDETFDAVLSTFGVQFAPRHAVAAAEMVRVARPGGRVVVCNWTPSGMIGELFSILGRFMPPAPAFASPPPLWGDEAHVRLLFADAGVTDVTFERATTPWAFASADDLVAFMETNYGPLLKARDRLTAEGSWDACRGEIVAMLERRNASVDDRLLVHAEYLISVARVSP